MLYILLLLYCYNVAAMSEQNIVAEKQFLLYHQAMLIIAENSTPIAKSLAKTYNMVTFLHQDEMQFKSTVVLLQLVNEKDPTLKGRIYNPELRSKYTKKHQGFYDNLVTAQQLKTQYTQNLVLQYYKIQSRIQMIHNTTIRDWLNAYLVCSVRRQDSFEYQEAKRVLAVLYHKYPGIITIP